MCENMIDVFSIEANCGVWHDHQPGTALCATLWCVLAQHQGRFETIIHRFKAHDADVALRAACLEDVARTSQSKYILVLQRK